MYKTLLLLSFCFARLLAEAATVDTIETISTAMNKSIKAVVITPHTYNEAKEMPVVYLLHGYSGNYADWITKVPSIQQLADNYQYIIVCPDGGFGSWYLDSPADSTYKYETYMINELIPFIDQRYKTVKSRRGRAITGLSMGGHGALYLAFKHQDIFGAAGSMSGGVDIRPFPTNWDLPKRLGAMSEHKDRWEQHTVTNLLHLLVPDKLAIIIDCGTADFFYTVNEQLHAKMMDRNIAHDYITRPGAHNWAYWSNSIAYQLLFMHRFFSAKE